MGNDDLTSRLRATFALELDEQVRQLNAALLSMERRPDDETIRTLFRSAHTIKGAARVAGEPVIEEACHALESVFAAVRDRRRQLSGGDFSLLFAIIDALAEAGEHVRHGRDVEGSSLHALLPRIREAAGEPAREEPADEPAHAETAREEPVPAGPTRVERAVEDRDDVQARAAAAGADVVRVDAARLDALLSAAGELITATGRLDGAVPKQDARRIRRATDAVVDIVHELRLRPFAEAADALPRAVRDVARSAGREVELEIRGADVEADRMVVDALREPLLQLVRNAVDHGIEPPDERIRRGKPRTGRIVVSAALVSGRLVVTVADDGVGLDEEAIRAELRHRGEPEPRTREALAEAVLGGTFSTRRKATAISGRGVGLDVVRSAMERIGGGVDVAWNPGAGTTFTLECPPRPMSLRAVLVRAATHVFALPTAHVDRLRRTAAGEFRQAEGRTVLPTGRGPIPVHPLAALLGPPLEPRPAEGSVTLVLVAAGSRRAALAVDAVLDETEVIVRPIDTGSVQLQYATGASVLPDGSVALVLNPAALLAAAGRAGTPIAPVIEAEREAPRPRILVADDSITTRTLEQSVLEAAGYEVATAVDGEDAWQKLVDEGADLLVADVAMPRMDGFALCRRIRASARFAQLPVVLVTGLETPEDRARGMEAGADAYIVKSSFDQASLIDTVGGLVGR